jgi:DNA-3-methyladenine glycosylase II
MLEFMVFDYPSIFSVNECLWFLNRNHDDPTHKLKDHKVYKIIDSSEGLALLQISFFKEHLEVKVVEGICQPENISYFINKWIDLKTDLSMFYDLLRANNAYSTLQKEFYGLRAIGIPDFFECICWSIIGQQINLSFAYKLKRALCQKINGGLWYNGQFYNTFPRPQDLLELEDQEYKALQFSIQKIRYIKNTAEAILNGDLAESKVYELEEYQDRIDYLCRIKGIGYWTAAYVLMKTINDPRCRLIGDAGLNQALFLLKEIPKKNAKELQKLEYHTFLGHESYFTYYLWRFLVPKPQ